MEKGLAFAQRENYTVRRICVKLIQGVLHQGTILHTQLSRMENMEEGLALAQRENRSVG